MLRRSMAWVVATFVGAVLSLSARTAFAVSPTVAECLTASEQGQQERDDGHYLRARTAFATCASDVCPAPVKRDCAQALLDLGGRMPTIVFAVRDAKGGDRSDVVVRMDGVVIASQLDGKPLPVDPGDHVFDLEVGGRHLERRALVAAGEKNRVVRVDLDDPAEPSAGPPLATLTFGSVAVVALGAATVLWITAKDDLRTIESSPCAATRTCDADELASIRTRLVAGDVSAVVGTLAAGAAIFFWMQSSRSRARLGPRFDPRHVLRLGGTF